MEVYAITRGQSPKMAERYCRSTTMLLLQMPIIVGGQERGCTFAACIEDGIGLNSRVRDYVNSTMPSGRMKEQCWVV